MDRSVGLFWHATHPQIYTSLRKLEESGFVQSQEEFRKRGPARKTYSITTEGKDHLRQQLLQEPIEYEIKFPLLVTIYFGGQLGPEWWKDTLKYQLAKEEVLLKIYRAIEDECPDVDPREDLKSYLRLRTLEFGIGYQRHFVHWLKSTIKELGKDN